MYEMSICGALVMWFVSLVVQADRCNGLHVLVQRQKKLD